MQENEYERITDEGTAPQDEPLRESAPEATRGFEPVAQAQDGGSGSTRRFELVNGKLSDTGEQPKKPAKKPRGKKQREKKPATKTGRAVGATVKGTLFVLKKALTYALNVLLTVLLVGIITGAVVALAFVIYIKNYVDADYTGLDNLKFDSSLSTTLYYIDRTGNEVLLENDTLESSENRMWVEYNDIPKQLVDAYVAVEDQRFWVHNGVDTTRTASAIYNFFVPTSSNYGGGSTITQQLIKNVSQENETTIQRKVQEIFRAMNVEKKYTKTEILEMYLNTIYLSHGTYGVRTAAETYFGKELKDLSLAECAAIAAIGKWPVHYDPITNPENNLERRNLVLKLMLEQGKITQDEFNESYDTPIRLAVDGEESIEVKVHSYYIDTVMDDVIADLMKEYGYDKATASRMLYSGGLQIITCLDPGIQECAERVFTDSSYWPAKKGMQAQSAICIMDQYTGELKAVVGGLGEKRESRGFNRATMGKRQCGSSIKPVSVYAYAIDNGIYNFGSAVDDVPPIYYPTTKAYWPYNADRQFRGRVSLDFAIQRSLNTIAVKTCLMLGIENVYNNLKATGYTSLVDSVTLADGTTLSDINASPLALGSFTYGVTTREMTQAYAALANGGKAVKGRTYSLVRDSQGRTILENRELQNVLYRESTSQVITSLLKHVVSGPYGTAVGAINFYHPYGVEVAGKTGSTNDSKDVYFCGYTPDYVGACWYGYDNGKAITTGGNCAAALWNSVFGEIYKYLKENDIEYTRTFNMNSVVTNVEYCTISGKLATDACRNDLMHKLGGMSCIAYGTFERTEVPTEYCDMHVMCLWDEKTGGLCLDGCNCPEEDLVEVGLRKMSFNDRLLHEKVLVQDAQFVYMEVPKGYVYPDDPDVPFFQKLLPEEYPYAFGYSVNERPANRICTEHYKPPKGSGTNAESSAPPDESTAAEDESSEAGGEEP